MTQSATAAERKLLICPFTCLPGKSKAVSLQLQDESPGDLAKWHKQTQDVAMFSQQTSQMLYAYLMFTVGPPAVILHCLWTSTFDEACLPFLLFLTISVWLETAQPPLAQNVLNSEESPGIEVDCLYRDREAKWTDCNINWEKSCKEVERRTDYWGIGSAQCSQNAFLSWEYMWLPLSCLLTCVSVAAWCVKTVHLLLLNMCLCLQLLQFV